MAKKNYKKYLPKVGGTVAVAMAMTVTISAQAHAAEVDEKDYLPDVPPADAETGSVGLLSRGVIEPAQANQSVADANADILDGNDSIIEGNQETQKENSDNAGSNESGSGGNLSDPGLDLPDAPHITGTDDMGAEEYNEAVGKCNDGVKDYNSDIDEYNKGVDEYNAAAGEYDQQAQQDYLNSQEYQDYLTAKAEWEAKDKAYQASVKAQEEFLQSQEYPDYLEDKAEYDQKVTENEIYDEVSEYNKVVEADNAKVESDNAALENDVDGNAGDISKVGEANRKLDLEDGIEDTLNSYNDLVQEQAALEAQGKALDDHAGKDAALGSDEYAAYLAAVEAYNAAVTEFNGKIDSYNEAVGKYNDAVNKYNEKQQNTSSSSTGEAQSTGAADGAISRIRPLPSTTWMCATTPLLSRTRK